MEAGKRTINKVLVANRGEIAVRVLGTCRRMGISTVAVYSEPDRDAPFVKMADESVCIGPALASESYLCGPKLIQAAKRTGAQAIHPGYGFLSENDGFAQLCADEGIIFIGPSAESIRAMGSKIRAKVLLSSRPHIPLIPGYQGDAQDNETLFSKALEVGFPVLLKASAGGGGKGMRIVREESGLLAAIETAKSEARNAFGDDTLLIERYFDDVKHVEVQIVGDSQGNVQHLYERECSIQRRHQKVLEEAPSCIMTAELRERMTRAAVEIGKSIAYQSLGTVEFIVDCGSDPLRPSFFFLEVNTRLQVEHPVTEMVTGLDLVRLQIEIARGKSLADLGIWPQPPPLSGHALEVRVCAEDPLNVFFPSSGSLSLWKPVDSPFAYNTQDYGPPEQGGHSREKWLRYDSGIESGSEVSVFYDPLLCKISTWGPSRSEAIERMKWALQQTAVLGLVTNKQFLQLVLLQPQFSQSSLLSESLLPSSPSSSSLSVRYPPFTTHFIDNVLPHEVRLRTEEERREAAKKWILGGACVGEWIKRTVGRSLLHHIPSGWRNNPSTKYSTKEFALKPINGQTAVPVAVQYRTLSKSAFEMTLDGAAPFTLELISWDAATFRMDLALDGLRGHLFLVSHHKAVGADRSGVTETVDIFSPVFGEFTVNRVSRFPSVATEDVSLTKEYRSPMPARVLKVLVSDKQSVNKDDTLLVIESMKMESRVLARQDGTVALFVQEGQLVDAGALLLTVD